MTPGKIKNKRLAGLCILGWVLFNYPILSLLNRDMLVFGIPLLYVFLFSSWAILIFFMACITFFRPKSTIPDSSKYEVPPKKKVFQLNKTRGR